MIRIRRNRRSRVKSCSKNLAAKASNFFKSSHENKAPKKITFSVDTLEVNEKKWQKPVVKQKRSQSLSSSSSNLKTRPVLNPYRRFLSDFNILIKSFPNFPSMMMKTLVQREKGNMVVVSKFLQSRGWKSSGYALNLLQNSRNIHFTISSFWGVDKPEYSSILEDKSPGSYFIVLCVPVYFVYYKTSCGIKKERVPTPDLQSLPKSKTIFFTNPISRPIDISSNDLLVFT